MVSAAIPLMITSQMRVPTTVLWYDSRACGAWRLSLWQAEVWSLDGGWSVSTIWVAMRSAVLIFMLVHSD